MNGYENLTTSSSSFDISAGMQALFFNNSLNFTSTTQTGYQDSLELQRNAVKESYSMTAIPVPPPASPNQLPDASAWLQQVSVGGTPGPQPLNYKLKSISSLMNSFYFPNDTQIAAKAAAFLQYVNFFYCAQVDGCSYQSKLGSLVAFYKGSSCPEGWVIHQPSEGRVIVAVNDSRFAGITVGQGLTDGEEPQHSHPGQMAFSFPNSDIEATDGDVSRVCVSSSLCQ